MTVFIVSQRASTIMGADKIIVMDDGHVAGIGTHDELLKTCDVYKEICQSQMSLDEAQGQHVQMSQPHDKLVQA
jgi:ATP-binding cassette subfamily B protein